MNQENMLEIRKISSKDWPKLQEIGKETFFETFSDSNSEEDMQLYLSHHFSEERVKANWKILTPYSILRKKMVKRWDI